VIVNIVLSVYSERNVNNDLTAAHLGFHKGDDLPGKMIPFKLYEDSDSNQINRPLSQI